jgi:hypothetical protein
MSTHYWHPDPHGRACFMEGLTIDACRVDEDKADHITVEVKCPRCGDSTWIEYDNKELAPFRDKAGALDLPKFFVFVIQGFEKEGESYRREE